VLMTGRPSHNSSSDATSRRPLNEVELDNDRSMFEAEAVASGESDNGSISAASDRERSPSGSDIDDVDIGADEAPEAVPKVELGLVSSEKTNSAPAATKSSHRSQSASKGGSVTTDSSACAADADILDAYGSSDESSGAASPGEWDLGNEDSVELDTAVAHFIAWLNEDLPASVPPQLVVASKETTAVSTTAAATTAATTMPRPKKRDAKTKPIAESAVIAQYYHAYPAAAALFRGIVSQV